MDSGLFVSSCSRRELARRRAAGRFWGVRTLVVLVRGRKRARVWRMP
jgi:hypothetical protein